MSEHVNTIWTDEQSEALKSFIAEGLTYQRAAMELNDIFDTKFSRCAASGRGYRIGLTAVEKPKRQPKPREPQPYRPRPKPTLQLNVEALQLQCSEIIPRNLKLVDLKQKDCRWPYGDGPFVHCGHGKLDGSSYCPGHYALSIGPGTTSERRANQVVPA